MLERIIKDVCEWHEKTFPDITKEDQIKKLEEELNEYYECYDYSELADVLICAIVLRERFGSGIGKCVFYYAKSIIQETRANMIVADKLRINKKRIWKKVDGVYRHVDEVAKDE